MEFEDEKIIAMRNQELKNKYNCIETGIYVRSELIKFAKSELFDNQIEMMLPELFFDMSVENSKKKYPSEDRPQIIKTNASGTINYTFSLLDQIIDSSQMKATVEDFRTMISKVYPANRFIDQGSFDIEKTMCCWIDFKGYTLNGATYNFLYVTAVKNKMLLGMFNCVFEDWISWKPIVLKTLETITFTEEGAVEK